jgi:hypothetical protein
VKDCLLAALLVYAAAYPTKAQHTHEAHQPEGVFSNILMLQASGTSLNPRSSPMDDAFHRRAGQWSFMLHGLVFVNQIQQRGPRGGDKFFSTNWAMGSAQRPLGRGTIQFRSMLSLEPATITKRRYPLLFQTGETAFGRPIIDGQHPHDLFMELSVQYARQLGERTGLTFYFAPVGDPALGPVAFPHRVSAMEIPQAPLAHHWQDSTHIANSVVTAGITHGMFRLEASGFHGQEPRENRWNIDHGAIDSWSARLSLSPSPNWTAQVSAGRLNEPEELEQTDIVRSTASITYNRPLAAGNWATSLIWGRNHKTFNQSNTNSYLLESVLQFLNRNYLAGRVELVDKDELFAHGEQGEHHPLENRVFRIGAYTLGYTRDVPLIPYLQTGIGANFTLYDVPDALTPYYGNRPAAFIAYLRFRLSPAWPQPHAPMPGP